MHAPSRSILGEVFTVKIKIANKKTYYLSDSLEPKERLVEVNKMMKDELEFDGLLMTVEEYFNYTWTREVNGANPTKNTLERLGTYLSKMPDQNRQQDKAILSRNDELEMQKGVRRVNRGGKNLYVSSRYIVNTDLSLEDKVELGLVDSDDIEYPQT